MPTVTMRDVTNAYDVAGDPDADPIVLVCGCGQPALAWNIGIVPALVRAGYRVVTFDNRGVAPSSSPPAPYTVQDLVADTLGLLDHLDIPSSRFVGHSMGGWVAETLAIRCAPREPLARRARHHRSASRILAQGSERRPTSGCRPQERDPTHDGRGSPQRGNMQRSGGGGERLVDNSQSRPVRRAGGGRLGR